MNRQTMIHLQLEHNQNIARALRELADKFDKRAELQMLHDGPILNGDGEQVGLVKTLYIGAA